MYISKKYRIVKFNDLDNYTESGYATEKKVLWWWRPLHKITVYKKIRGEHHTSIQYLSYKTYQDAQKAIENYVENKPLNALERFRQWLGYK